MDLPCSSQNAGQLRSAGGWLTAVKNLKLIFSQSQLQNPEVGGVTGQELSSWWAAFSRLQSLPPKNLQSLLPQSKIKAADFKQKYATQFLPLVSKWTSLTGKFNQWDRKLFLSIHQKRRMVVLVGGWQLTLWRRKIKWTSEDFVCKEPLWSAGNESAEATNNNNNPFYLKRKKLRVIIHNWITYLNNRVCL